MRIRLRKSVKKMWNPLTYLTLEEKTAILLQGGCLFTFFCLSVAIAWKVFRRVQRGRGQEEELPAWDVSKGHRWGSIDLFPNTAYCSICTSLIVDGYHCDCCGVCSDAPCLKKADKTLRCKALSATDTTTMKHHWVKGNLPYVSECEVCQGECGLEGLTDLRCCWCQRVVHKNCADNLGETCDFGRFKSFVVPPSSVTLRRVGMKGRRHLIVEGVRPPPYRPWRPLIVIGNRKSGNNQGDLVLKSFRAYLNPAQVIDLAEVKPEKGLQWCKLIREEVCRILVAGGDGTVGWVLNAIDKLCIEPLPQMCILPLGTGNDLSRVLGWGYCFSGEVEVKRILDQIATATTTKLDRWKVVITPQRHIPMRPPFKEYFMNNYLSVGVDALVALNFHRTRESKFYLFGNRLINRFLYVVYGAKDILERGCENVQNKIQLYLDDRLVELPELEAVVLLNIPSWGGGVQPWGMGGSSSPSKRLSPQRVDDGLLEVMGIYSSFHIAQMQMGLSEPLRIGQAKTVRIKFLECLPIQIDGEPWEQAPCDLTLSHHSQATFLSNTHRHHH